MRDMSTLLPRNAKSPLLFVSAATSASTFVSSRVPAASVVPVPPPWQLPLARKSVKKRPGWSAATAMNPRLAHAVIVLRLATRNDPVP